MALSFFLAYSFLADLAERFSFHMKRLSKRRRKWFSHRRRLVAKKGSLSKRHRLGKVDLLASTGETWTANIPARVPLPAVMCFDDNCAETLKSISSLRNHLLAIFALARRRAMLRIPKAKKRRLVGYRDFATITRITPAAALVLAAEFERMKILTGNPPVVVNVGSWSPQVFETLWEIGFFAIVGFAAGQKEPEVVGSVKVLKMRSGNTADANEIATLIAGLKELYPGEEQSVQGGMTHLYGAMIEAVGNVCGHAYPHPAPVSVGRWWMTGAVDAANRRTTAVIFDQGISIPVSLPTWSRYAGFARRFMAALRFGPDSGNPQNDGDAIAVAVEEAVSSTGAPHRGQGLAQMKNFVDLCRDGYLRIMSRNGEVVFRPGCNPTVNTHSVSVGGTLIEWNVSI